LTARHYSNSQSSIISLDYSWFLAKNLSKFVSLPWKLHNRYCQSWYKVDFAVFCHNQSSLPTGKSLSEAFILTSTNPQYDKRLFIDFPVQYMKTTSSEHVVYMNCFECQNKNKKIIYVHNMFWACSFHVLNW
jgi:hypothetical protein